MRPTQNRRNGLGLVCLIFAVPGMTAIAGAQFLAGGVQCKQVFVQRNGIADPFLAQSRWAQTSEAQASTNAQQRFFSLLKIEDAEETLPQIVIQGKPFTVVVHKHRLEWPADARRTFDPDGDETG